jgi:hypothetical protein
MAKEWNPVGRDINQEAEARATRAHGMAIRQERAVIEVVSLRVLAKAITSIVTFRTEVITRSTVIIREEQVNTSKSCTGTISHCSLHLIDWCIILRQA